MGLVSLAWLGGVAQKVAEPKAKEAQGSEDRGQDCQSGPWTYLSLGVGESLVFTRQ